MKDMRDRYLPSKSELENWLNSSVTKALMEDMIERKEDSMKIATSNLLTSSKEIAEVNKQIGILENIEYLLAFPTLLLDDIMTEQNLKEKEKENNNG